jgi:hypothetical protein
MRIEALHSSKFRLMGKFICMWDLGGNPSLKEDKLADKSKKGTVRWQPVNCIY